MMDDRAPLRLAALSTACLLAAGAALLAPILLADLLAADDPAEAYPAALRHAWAARGVAALLALAGGAALVAAARRRPRLARGSRVAAFALAALALALASPLADHEGAARIEERYAPQGGLLARAPEADLASPPAPAEDLRVFTGRVDADEARAPLRVGPVPARAGDAWAVGLRVRGPAWEGDARPALGVDIPARCVPDVVLDDREVPQAQGFIAWWRCVALAEGEATLLVTLPQPSEGRVAVQVDVVPSYDMAAGAWANESLAALAGVASAAAWVASHLATRKGIHNDA